MILNQFDPNPRAVINPEDTVQPVPGFPKVGVSCFSYKLFDRMIEPFHPKPIAKLHLANVTMPVYEIEFRSARLAAYVSPVGGPACVGVYEDALALGLEKLVLFGNCGVLDRSIEDCSIIIPTSAVRDEGTSYHYAPASNEITVNPTGIGAFRRILDGHGCAYTLGKLWTNDAIYRETPTKVAARRAMGCVGVEMEAACMAAAAQFRQKELFHFIYAGDNLDGDRWDPRSLGGSVNLDAKMKVALLALEMAAQWC